MYKYFYIYLFFFVGTEDLRYHVGPIKSRMTHLSFIPPAPHEIDSSEDEIDDDAEVINGPYTDIRVSSKDGPIVIQV